MKKKYLFLWALALCLSVGALAVISRSYADQDRGGHTNTFKKVVDEFVHIPEPESNKGKVPQHIRWEPMLGCYIVKDAKYDPATKSFIIPENAESAVDPNDELDRIGDWMKENSQTTDRLYAGLLAYMKSLEENPSLSSKQLPGNNAVIVNAIIPLGIPYLNEMLDMVMNRKLFDVPLMYSIEQITGVTCKPENMSFDDYEPTHDAWRSNMRVLLGDVETAVKGNKDVSKYGIFALPYVIDDHTNEELQSYLASQSDILGKNGFTMNNIGDVSTWAQENKELITQIRNCVSRYK